MSPEIASRCVKITLTHTYTGRGSRRRSDNTENHLSTERSKTLRDEVGRFVSVSEGGRDRENGVTGPSWGIVSGRLTVTWQNPERRNCRGLGTRIPDFAPCNPSFPRCFARVSDEVPSFLLEAASSVPTVRAHSVTSVLFRRDFPTDGFAGLSVGVQLKKWSGARPRSPAFEGGAGKMEISSPTKARLTGDTRGPRSSLTSGDATRR